MKNIIRSLNWGFIFLWLILVVVFIANYTPGTFLIGWDNLVPELNIWMNLKRSLFSVWQEYQGLGLVGGMGHATDLIRQLIMLPFTYIFPQSFIRYFWHFAMIALGTYGIYFGLCRQKFPRLTATAASLFYLLNFGSIQNFWAPLETFSAFWGFFPWLIFSLWEYLQHPSRKSVLRLGLVNLLAIPGFYVQTLFIVYLICISLVLFSNLILTSNFKFQISNSIKIIVLIFMVNSFWLLPFAYFVRTNLRAPTIGMGNVMATEDTFDRNERRGYFSDFFLLRGYYYDYTENNGFFMNPWVEHFSYPGITFLGYGLSAFVVLGLISILYRYKKINIVTLSLLLLLLLSMTALVSSTFPFNLINALLRKAPLIDQVFRSSFTKFAAPAVFTFSLLSAYGLNTLSNFLRRFGQNFLHYLVFSLYFLALVVFSAPVFTGNYISPKMRLPLPSDYLDLIDYFKSVPSTARIANLPQGSFWGWTNYNWKLTGSGFIWYGLPQPVLDRAFDVWNLSNEQYFWELTSALQSQDTAAFQNVLTKFSIEYVVFDHSVIFPDDKIFNKLSVSTDQFLRTLPGLTLVKTIGNIDIYRSISPTAPYLLASPPAASRYEFAYKDTIYSNLGDYQASTTPQYVFPYIGLFTNRLQSELPSYIPSLSSRLGDAPDLGLTHTPLPHPDQPDYYLKNTLDNSLFVFNFSRASLNQSYLAEIEYRHVAGKSLEITAVSENQQEYYFHTKLDKPPSFTKAYFIIPAREASQFNSGINFIFWNSSVSHFPTINIIKSIKLHPFDYEGLINTYTPADPVTPSPRNYLNFESSIFTYRIDVPPSPLATHLVLPQAFDRGWLAFYFDGFRPIFLKDHVLINNWANGWAIPSQLSNSNSKIYAFFWPQLLEFIGLLLIPVTLFRLFRSKSTSSEVSV